MGLVTLPIPGGQLQYFSFSEEILSIGNQAVKFILNLSPAWLIVVVGLCSIFIIGGVFYRIATEFKGLPK
jgi:hypothetical protein